MTEQMRETVAQKIEAAFSDTPYPGEGNICHDPYQGVQEDFWGKHWKDLSLDLIIRHRDKIPSLTPEAFRFYLPAFMNAVLFHYDEVDTLPINVMTSLTPPTQESQGRWPMNNLMHGFLRNVEGFSVQEKIAILAFLESYSQLVPEHIAVGELKLLDGAIAYWKSGHKGAE